MASDRQQDVRCLRPALSITRALADNDLAPNYARLPNVDFSRDILARQPKRLLVLRGTGWADFGSPDRVTSRGLILTGTIEAAEDDGESERSAARKSPGPVRKRDGAEAVARLVRGAISDAPFGVEELKHSTADRVRPNH